MAEPTDKELRGPVNLRIKFRSASLQQFIERYGVDVSRGGIFIRTREPLPVGTRLKLDFQLVDAAPLFQGDGTVVWIREYDPGKTGVTPGMGVRFDRLTPESQPTLDKILEEKMRLQQTGVAPGAVVKAGAGLAVRRPSGAVATLDTLGSRPPPPPPVAIEAKVDAPSVGAAPVTTMPASQSRSGPVASSTGGIFSRPRTTGTMSALRAAPVPSALFEPPTAADIDKALLALEEKGPSPSLPAPPPPAPITVARGGMGDDEPTKVFDVAAQDFAAHEAVTGQGAGVLPESGVPIAAGDDGNGDLTAKRSVEPSEPIAVVQSTKDDPTAPHVATSLDAPLAAHLDGTAPAAGPAGAAGREPAGATTSAVPKRITVDSPSRAIESGRFRSDAKYRRSSRNGAKIVISLLLAGAAAAGVVFGKREWDKRKAAATDVAATPAPTAPPSPAAPAPSEPGAPGTAPQAGAAAGDTVGTVPAAPAPAAPAAPAEAKTETKIETKTAAASGKTETAPAKPPGEKSARATGDEERPSKSGGSRRRKAAEATAAAPAPAPEKTDKTATPPAAAPAGEQRPPAEAAAAAPAPAPAATGGEAPKTAEAAPAEKPVLKITSTPAGAEVVIDGSTVGTTPFQSKEIDPTAAHAITVRKDGYEAHERMISGSDWSRARGGGQSLKMNIKLKRTAPAPSEAPKDESPGKASDVEVLTPSEP